MRSYDFVHERTHDGRTFRLLTILDEHTRECLAITAKRQMNHQSVLDRLAELFVNREYRNTSDLITVQSSQHRRPGIGSRR